MSFITERNPVLKAVLPALLLFAAACLAYANTWPNTLVLDDKPFLDYQRFNDWSEIPSYFSENAWAARGVSSDLYRPLLSVSVTLDANLFKNWYAGYHLTNTVLHALVTVFLFALLARLLARDPRVRESSILAAFLAALIFAVHPVNTEVVNSIFNRSSMLAALGVCGGLWWLLRYLETKPVRAWTGLFLAYTYALFCRETAIVLPGIAAALVFIYADGPLLARVRKALPVLVLLVPMVLYLAMRDNALSDRVPDDTLAESDFTSIVGQVESSRLLEGKMILDVAGVWAEALHVILWPFQLQVSRGRPPVIVKWIGLFLHLGLVGLALYQFRRGRKGLLAGLAIFYLALLPSSRLFGGGRYLPHLGERYLYEPMIGLALLAAYGLSHLNRRSDRLLAAAPVVLCLLILAPVTWARNAQWSDELNLFESDYKNGVRTGYLLRLLTGAHLRAGNFPRVLEVCDANRDVFAKSGSLSNHCASAYSYTGRNEDAERTYAIAVQHENQRRLAHWNFGQHYMRQQRPEDASAQFELAVEAENDPAKKAYYKGYSIMILNPATPGKWLEARGHLEEAVRLDPGYGNAQSLLDQINVALGEAAATSR